MFKHFEATVKEKYANNFWLQLMILNGLIIQNVALE